MNLNINIKENIFKFKKNKIQFNHHHSLEHYENDLNNFDKSFYLIFYFFVKQFFLYFYNIYYIIHHNLDLTYFLSVFVFLLSF